MRSAIGIDVTFIRHGRTEYNRQGRYLGWTDIAVSEKGMENIRIWRQEKPECYPPAKYIFRSPMLRCEQTAEALYPKQKLLVIPEWKEMNFGDFEGRSADEMADDAAYRSWVDSECTIQVPNGENQLGFRIRSMQGLFRCLTEICKAENIEPAPEIGNLSEAESIEQLTKKAMEWSRKYVDSVAAVPTVPKDLLQVELEDRTVENDIRYTREISVAAVVHAGTIMAIVSTLTGAGYYDCYVHNGEGFRLRFCI